MHRLDASVPVWGLAALTLVLLMGLPLGWLVTLSVSGEHGPTTQHYLTALRDLQLRRALWNTLVMAFWTGVASVAIGAPLAWLTARTDLPGRRLVRALVMASFVTPPFLGAVAWVMLAHMVTVVGLLMALLSRRAGVSVSRQVRPLAGLAVAGAACWGATRAVADAAAASASGVTLGLAVLAGTLAYPELKTVGDLDNAIVTLVFEDGRLGVVDLSRNGIYGYDITTELLGTEGTLRVGYLRETPLLVMKKNQVSHDTVPHFMERFEKAYTAQLQDFARNVLEGRPAPVTLDDGLAALRIALAARRSHETGQPVEVASVTA